jgi:type VII secretion protein EccB
MPSRQDQLHSYQFMVQRVVAALVMRDTDPAQSPFRRAAGATLASVLVAAIAVGGFAVYGAIRGSGAETFRDTDAVIIERESGARYVYRDEKLHLVLNYASALMIVGSANPKTVLVSRSSIEGVPRGATLGIPEAPDSLPAADRLLGPPWTVCSTAAAGGPRSTLLVGGEPPDGTTLGGKALLVQHPDGSVHLLWQNRRHLVRDRDLVLSALGWSTMKPLLVAPALLNALPTGADLARVPIAGVGGHSAVPAATVGEVFVVDTQGGARQFAVALRRGLAGITQVQADLLLTSLRQDKPTVLTQGRFASIRKLPDLVPTDPAAPPATTPELAGAASGALCARMRDDSGVSELRTGASALAAAGGVAGPGVAAPGGGVDSVVVEPGRGAIVESSASPGATGGALSLITDLGRRHPLAGTDVLSMLGYGGAKPTRLPSGLVSLVPPGPALDPEAARTPVS